MGQLVCKRCFAQATADTKDEADSIIDHAIGQTIGRPCSGKDEDLVWREDYRKATTATIEVEKVQTETKSKKKSKRR